MTKFIVEVLGLFVWVGFALIGAVSVFVNLIPMIQLIIQNPDVGRSELLYELCREYILRAAFCLFETIYSSCYAALKVREETKAV